MKHEGAFLTTASYDNAKRQGEEQKRIERRMEAIIAHRHETARAALKIEDTLRSLPDYASATQLIDLASMAKRKLTEHHKQPEQAQRMENIYGQAILAYSESVRAVERIHDLVKREAQRRFHTPDPTPQQYGRVLLERYTGQRAKRAGKVYYQKHPGYVVIGCPRRVEYGALLNKDPDATIVKESGGVFTFFTFTVGKSTERIPVIMIPEEPSHAYRWKDALEHEQQHFFHHVALHVFSTIEQGPTDPESQDIKDEILAYLKEGEDPETITMTLQEPLYHNLFEGMRESKKKKMLQIIEGLMVQIQKTVLWNMPSPRARALLVNHLLDIPLLRWHAWIPHIDRYYRQKYLQLPRSVREYTPSTPLQPGILCLSTDLQPYAVKLQTHEQGMTKLQEHIFTAALGYGTEDEANSLEEMTARFTEHEIQTPHLLSKTPPIHVFFPQTEILKDYLKNHGPTELQVMGTAIIDTLQKAYTQPVLYRIWTSLSQHNPYAKEAAADLQKDLHRILRENEPFLAPPTPTDIHISSNEDKIFVNIRLIDGTQYQISLPV